MNRIVVLAFAFALVTASAHGGTEKVKFPADYASKYLQYTSIDKPNAKRGHTVRNFFIDRDALEAVKAGRALPSGTVIVREDWHVKLDAAKSPVKGAEGRFIATKKKGVQVMEKRDGWGAEYAAGFRNGNWEYASFKPDGKRNTRFPIKRCFGCHKRKAKDDFVFSMKALKTAAAK